MELSVTHMATEQDVYRWHRYVKFPDPQVVAQQEILVKSLVFPGPGR